MGFELMVNFNLPYFAANPQEFWRRWHISLSTWLRDYLYIPLGGNRKGTRRTYINLFITMLLGGLWHGAAWTFAIWGAFHGLLFLVYEWLRPLTTRIKFTTDFAQKVWFIMRIALFFNLIALPTLAFRAASVTQTYDMFSSLITNFQMPDTGLPHAVLKTVFYVGVLVTVQVFQYRKNDLMVIQKCNILIKAIFYCICFYLLIMFGAGGGQEFIYFQF